MSSLPAPGGIAMIFDNDMKLHLLLFWLTFLSLSCKEQSREFPPDSETGNSLANEFQLALKNKQEIVFIDSSNRGASMDGSILNLHFFENSKLHAYTYGNGFSNYLGSYAFPGNNRIEIQLKDQDWPELVLSKEGDRFFLRRRDGSRSLTNHIVFTDKDGTRSVISDGDIYPEAESRIFPLKQKVSEVERGTADQATASVELKPE